MLPAFLLLTLAAASQTADWDNPYAKATSEFEARLKAAQFGKPGADPALDHWLRAHSDLPATERLRGYKQLCGDYGVRTLYRLRVAACKQEARLKKQLGVAKEGDDDQSMSVAFAAQPAIRASGSARVPLVWNAFGSQSTDVSANGVTSSWFVDTGAEITVVTSSLAKRMKVMLLGDKVRVGTTTSDVFGGVGLIRQLKIGSATVDNVPVLILPDAQLKLGNVHQIDGILGLQVMAAFGRVAWVDGGRSLALGSAAPKASPSALRLYWDSEGLGVPVGIGSRTMGAFLDTGSNATHWRTAGLPLLEKAVLATAKEKTMHVGGAGGVVEIKERELPVLEFRLGGIPVRVPGVSLTESDKGTAAQVGMDAVAQFGTFVLDFQHMRIDGKLKTPAELEASRPPELTNKDIVVDQPKKDEEHKPN